MAEQRVKIRENSMSEKVENARKKESAKDI
jgi:hypothetical protein